LEELNELKESFGKMPMVVEDEPEELVDDPDDTSFEMFSQKVR